MNQSINASRQHKANEEKQSQQRHIQHPPRIQQQAHGHACIDEQTNKPSSGAFDCRLLGCAAGAECRSSVRTSDCRWLVADRPRTGASWNWSIRGFRSDGSVSDPRRPEQRRRRGLSRGDQSEATKNSRGPERPRARAAKSQSSASDRQTTRSAEPTMTAATADRSI